MTQTTLHKYTIHNGVSVNSQSQPEYANFFLVSDKILITVSVVKSIQRIVENSAVNCKLRTSKLQRFFHKNKLGFHRKKNTTH